VPAQPAPDGGAAVRLHDVTAEELSAVKDGLLRIEAARAASVRYHDERLTADRIGAEVNDALWALSASRKRLHVAQAELRLAAEDEEDERTRLALGDGNILFVNLREQATAEAALREIDALLDNHRAYPAYRAAMALDE
jgi:hypothetical protein